MKKWLYEKELAHAQNVLITAYLLTTHSKTITVTFEHDGTLYAHDLTESETRELARIAPMDCKNGFLLKTQKISAKRKKTYLSTAYKICSIAEKSIIAEQFPQYNNGVISEFCYRRYITGEKKLAFNGIPYDKGSDTIDNKQIKDITTGATFTNVEYLQKVCADKGLNDLAAEIVAIIEKLKEIYEF